MIKDGTALKVELSDDLIEKREKRWHKDLPKEYKSFLKKYNGALCDNNDIIGDKWSIDRFLCIVPQISESENGNYDIDAIITKYDEYMVFDGDSDGPDLIPIALLNHDSILCLCYKTEEPSVAVWELEGSKEFSPKYTVVYDSFNDFLRSIDL